MIALGALLGLLGAANVAHAKGSRDLGYRFDQVWSACIRLVRVDYGFPVRDRDEEVGYLLFDYEDGNRSYPGSFEVVRTRQDDRKRIRVVLTIPAMPSYIETMMLDKLEDKLEEDFGPPPPPKRKRPDEGKGDDDEDDNDGGDDGSDEGG